MLRQLWQKTTGDWLPRRCLVCRLPCPRGSQDLCPWCYQALPWLDRQVCHGCGVPLSDGVSLCGPCLRKPPPWHRVCSVLKFAPVSQHLLHQLKFRHQACAAPILADLLARELLEQGELDDLVLMAVPMTPWREAGRGYNQAELLAQELSKRLDLPLLRGRLSRRGRQLSQSQLSARQRKKNLARAFHWRGDRCPARVALVDDVVTTGATCQAAARILLHNGCRELEIWSPVRTVKARPGD